MKNFEYKLKALDSFYINLQYQKCIKVDKLKILLYNKILLIEIRKIKQTGFKFDI